MFNVGDKVTVKAEVIADSDELKKRGITVELVGTVKEPSELFNGVDFGHQHELARKVYWYFKASELIAVAQSPDPP